MIHVNQFGTTTGTDSVYCGSDGIIIVKCQNSVKFFRQLQTVLSMTVMVYSQIL